MRWTPAEESVFCKQLRANEHRFLRRLFLVQRFTELDAPDVVLIPAKEQLAQVVKKSKMTKERRAEVEALLPAFVRRDNTMQTFLHICHECPHYHHPTGEEAFADGLPIHCSKYHDGPLPYFSGCAFAPTRH